MDQEKEGKRIDGELPLGAGGAGAGSEAPVGLALDRTPCDGGSLAGSGCLTQKTHRPSSYSS